MRVGEKKRKPRHKSFEQKWWERGDKHSRQLDLKPEERAYLARLIRHLRLGEEASEELQARATAALATGQHDPGLPEFVTMHILRRRPPGLQKGRKPDA